MPHETDQVPESEAGGWKSWVPESVRHLLPTASPAEDWTQFVPAEWRRWLTDSPAPRPQTRTLRFIGIDEDTAGPALELALPRDVGRLPSLVAGS